jgi:hypothetical protein
LVLDDQGEVLAGGFVSGEAKPDIEAVNTIARLALMARRSGTRFKLADACPELLELLELAGLAVEVER